MKIVIAKPNRLGFIRTMTIMTIREGHQDAIVEIVRETEKAILVRGKCSQAWFPRAALEADGTIKDWFVNRMTLVHGFLFSNPIQ